MFLGTYINGILFTGIFISSTILDCPSAHVEGGFNVLSNTTSPSARGYFARQTPSLTIFSTTTDSKRAFRPSLHPSSIASELRTNCIVWHYRIPPPEASLRSIWDLCFVLFWVIWVGCLYKSVVKVQASHHRSTRTTSKVLSFTKASSSLSVAMKVLSLLAFSLVFGAGFDQAAAGITCGSDCVACWKIGSTTGEDIKFNCNLVGGCRCPSGYDRMHCATESRCEWVPLICAESMSSGTLDKLWLTKRSQKGVP